MARTFGRDDMDALLGGSKNEEEMAAFRPSHAGPQLTNQKKTLPNAAPDISTMSAAETAEMLNQKNAEKVAKQQSSRYRTKRSFDHHALAQELSNEMQIEMSKKKMPEPAPAEADNDSDGDDFMERSKAVRRERSAPQVISRRKDPAESRDRRSRRTYDDSSSSDDSRKRRRGRPSRRRRDEESSSSSSDEEDDSRRKRLLMSRKRHEPEIIRPARKVDNEGPIQPVKKAIEPPSPEPPVEVSSKSKKSQPQKEMSKKDRDSGSGSSSSSSSGSSSESSSSSEESSSEEEHVMSKPIFIAKHKRNLIQSEDSKWQEEEARAEREKQRAEKRKMESRALVAKAVAAVESAAVVDDLEDENGGATNDPPNDDDDIDKEKEYQAWEIRELERLLDEIEKREQREQERKDYERRKHMTDEEVLQADIKAGRYHAPGSSRQEREPGKFMQRFYHRGAYYMEEDEWDKDDVRHKAAEYATAATGEDKIDRSALPEVMQVKKFGFAGQNKRYKGLANEDTTDKHLEVLPLPRKK